METYTIQDDLFSKVCVIRQAEVRPPSVPVATSEEAAEKIKPDTKVLRGMVFGFILGRGSYGATDQEIEDALGIDGNTERPRRWELGKKPFYAVVNSGMKRETRGKKRKCHAIVWEAIRETMDKIE